MPPETATLRRGVALFKEARTAEAEALRLWGGVAGGALPPQLGAARLAESQARSIALSWGDANADAFLVFDDAEAGVAEAAEIADEPDSVPRLMVVRHVDTGDEAADEADAERAAQEELDRRAQQAGAGGGAAGAREFQVLERRGHGMRRTQEGAVLPVPRQPPAE